MTRYPALSRCRRNIRDDDLHRFHSKRTVWIDGSSRPNRDTARSPREVSIASQHALLCLKSLCSARQSPIRLSWLEPYSTERHRAIYISCKYCLILCMHNYQRCLWPQHAALCIDIWCLIACCFVRFYTVVWHFFCAARLRFFALPIEFQFVLNSLLMSDSLCTTGGVQMHSGDNSYSKIADIAFICPVWAAHCRFP
jgi:hypothetical protein